MYNMRTYTWVWCDVPCFYYECTTWVKTSPHAQDSYLGKMAQAELRIVCAMWLSIFTRLASFLQFPTSETFMYIPIQLLMRT